MEKRSGSRVRRWVEAVLVAVGTVVGFASGGLVWIQAAVPAHGGGYSPPVPASQEGRGVVAWVVLTLGGAILAVALLRAPSTRRLIGLAAGGVVGFLLVLSWSIQERAYPIADGAGFTERRNEYTAAAVSALQTVCGAGVGPTVTWNAEDDDSSNSRCETSQGVGTGATRLFLEVSVPGRPATTHQALLRELAAADLHPRGADHDEFRDVSVSVGRRNGADGSETVIYVATPCLRDP